MANPIDPPPKGAPAGMDPPKLSQEALVISHFANWKIIFPVKKRVTLR